MLGNGTQKRKPENMRHSLILSGKGSNTATCQCARPVPPELLEKDRAGKLQWAVGQEMVFR
jgi:hypothetical protein